jgi:hypothetical protein
MFSIKLFYVIIIFVVLKLLKNINSCHPARLASLAEAEALIRDPAIVS